MPTASNAPASHAEPDGRGVPRWSTGAHSDALAASMAALPANNGTVGEPPPFIPKVPIRGFANLNADPQFDSCAWSALG